MGLIAYLLMAVVSIAVVRRIFLPISLRACAALILLPLLFTLRAFVTGGVFAPIDLAYQTEPLVSYLDSAGVHQFHNPTLSDTYAQMIPWRDVVREAIFSGEWPLINPYMLGGDLLAGSAQPAPYDFLNLAGLLVPLVDSINVTASLAFLWAAIGAFLLARRFGVSEIAALFAAIAWMASSFVTFFIEAALGHTILLLPLVCVAAIDVVRACGPALAGSDRLKPVLTRVLVLAVILAWLIFAGHPETLLQTVLIACAFAIYELIRVPGQRGRAVIACIIGGFVAVLLAAVFLLPLIDALPQTTEYALRQARGSEDLETVSWSLAMKKLPVNFVPFLYGTPWKEMGSETPLLTPHNAIISGIFLALAIAGAVLTRRWFLIGLAVFGILAGIGFPPLVDAFQYVPLLSMARNERFIAATVLAFALLGAMAIETRQTVRIGWTILLVALALLGFIVALTPMMHDVKLTTEFIRESSTRMLLPMFIASAALLVFGTVGLKPDPHGARGEPVARCGTGFSPSAYAVLMLIAIVNRTGGLSGMYPTIPREAFYRQPAQLRSLPGGLYRFAAEQYALLPNVGTHYRLEDVRGFQAMSLQRLQDTFPLWCVAQRNWFNRIDSLASPFLSFLNVRYALHDRDNPLPANWRTVGAAGALDLVENMSVLPRAFIPAVVHYGDDVAAMMGASDFAHDAWIARGAGLENNGSGNVTIYRHNLSAYRLHAQLAGDAWIVVSQPAWKGWRAFDGGHEIPVRFANHAFVGIRLTRGAHDVVLRFAPHSFVVGRAISTVTLAALIVISLWLRLSH